MVIGILYMPKCGQKLGKLAKVGCVAMLCRCLYDYVVGKKTLHYEIMNVTTHFHMSKIRHIDKQPKAAHMLAKITIC